MEVAVKDRDEFRELLKGVENVAIFACKLCFKEFERDRSDELEGIREAIEAAGKNIAVIEEIDFLCIRTSTEKVLTTIDLDKVDAIVTSSCGVGTQLLASISEKPVVAGADTMGGALFRGFVPEGEAGKLCRACGQCVLNYTGGICPVSYCPKFLLNGPCGGAVNGKCEVDGERDCVWLKIYERLKRQGRTDLMKGGVRVMDHGRPAFDEVKSLADDATARRGLGFYGGVFPLEMKEATAGSEIETLPMPEILVVPVSQQIGAPNAAAVRVGDEVKMGDLIAKADAFVSAPVHSPVSGKVMAIEARPHPVIPVEVKAIVIENDHKDTLSESVAPGKSVNDLTGDEIIEIVRDKGIVGMGGAMFPTHVKIRPVKPIDLLIINGCECEPFLTADHRMMVEKPGEIVEGIRLIAKAAGVKECIIAVEDNKLDAVEALKKFEWGGVRVEVLRTKYPQGSERMLVWRLTGKEVPKDGGLPLDVGVVVSNVGTAYAVYDAVVNGMPLIERVVTITGDGIKRPGNYRVRVGTPISYLLEEVSDIPPRELLSKKRVKVGGAMMGIVQSTLDVPVLKGTSGVTVLPLPDIEAGESDRCIRCGNCVSACPMELMPHRLWHCVKERDVERLKEYAVYNCIECGCCEYICSAKLPLVGFLKEGKRMLKDAENR
ncbi:MAG: electron transport complex subunit RsxC [Deltaproteobacteria bacterium]|uniref:Ion-translocating oxidoreductase complex subunit C n=1 Tax=Candidatus Zymogenus saltonus TaxID=2844893 RepID=A0A9D8KGF0_9DELT|nr:electron transport complex subunit RsxC [Candidatus Zymogenus saltonus]